MQHAPIGNQQVQQVAPGWNAGVPGPMQHAPIGNQQLQQVAPGWNGAVPGFIPAQVNAHHHPHPHPHPLPHHLPHARSHPNLQTHHGFSHDVAPQNNWQLRINNGGHDQMGAGDQWSHHNLPRREAYASPDPPENFRGQLLDAARNIWHSMPFVNAAPAPPVHRGMELQPVHHS